MKLISRHALFSRLLGPCAAALVCLALSGCHSLTGSHQPGMYQPSAARDEAIRKKAEKDPFAAEGQPVVDATPAQTLPTATRRR